MKLFHRLPGCCLLLLFTSPAFAAECLQNRAFSSDGKPILLCDPAHQLCTEQPPIVLFLIYPRSALNRFFSQGMTISQIGLSLLSSVSEPSRDGGRLAYRCEATNPSARVYRCQDVQSSTSDPLLGRVLDDGLIKRTTFSLKSYAIYHPVDLVMIHHQYVCNSRLATVQEQRYAFGPAVRSISRSDGISPTREHTSDFIMRIELLDYKPSSFKARDQRAGKRFGWSVDPGAIAPLLRNLF